MKHFIFSLLVGVSCLAVATPDPVEKTDSATDSAAAKSLASFLDGRKLSCKSSNKESVINIELRQSNKKNLTDFTVESNTGLQATDLRMEETESFFIIFEEVNPPDNIFLLIPKLNSAKLEKDSDFDITMTFATNGGSEIMKLTKLHCKN